MTWWSVETSRSEVKISWNSKIVHLVGYNTATIVFKDFRLIAMYDVQLQRQAVRFLTNITSEGDSKYHIFNDGYQQLLWQVWDRTPA
jgi:hypothetical protein